jgi:hypothetical protein
MDKARAVLVDLEQGGALTGMAIGRCIRSPGVGGTDAPGQDQYWETLLMISFMISVVPPPMLRMRESR